MQAEQKQENLNQMENIPWGLVSLGALYWASENRPEWTGFESGRDLLVMAFGGGSSEFFINQIKNFIPGGMAGLTDDALQGIAGALLVRYGDRLHEQVQNVGRGVLMDLGMRVVKESGYALQDLVGGLLGQEGSCNQRATVNVQQDNAPEPVGGYNEAGNPRTMAEFVNERYGVKLS